MNLWALKVKTSLAADFRVLAIPSYGLLATALALVVLWVFLWLFNLNLLFTVLAGGLGISEKIAFALAGYQSLLSNFDSPQAITLLAFSVLSGINLAVLVFVIRHGLAGTKSSGANFFAAVFALIGSGCAVCGGTILGPLAAIAGASLSTAATRTIGTSANFLGIALVCYSIYGLGKTAAQIQARARLPVKS